MYTANLIKDLLPIPTSYKDVVLEKLEPEDDEESSQTDLQFRALSNQSVRRLQRKPGAFVKIQSIWYRLSPGQIFLVCFFISIFTALLWSTYRPEQWIKADNLVGFLVCLLFGYGGFVVTQYIGSAKEEWFAFFQWKLPMIVIMVAGWGFAVWFLYKFVILIVQR